MPRQPRHAPPGLIYHVLNRSAGRVKLFRTPADFQAFDRLLLEAHERCPLPVFSYCVMNNHWHFVVGPKREGELTDFFRWLAHTHAMRWRVAHHNVGYGHLYGGRFKAFPVQPGPSFLQVCRYVERNPLTAKAVQRAEDYPWSSLWVRRRGRAEQKQVLCDWPMERPADWLKRVNEVATKKELDAWRISLERGRPFGDDAWQRRISGRLHLEHTLRKEGRMKQVKETNHTATTNN